MKVTVWNEFYHEKKKPQILEMYPGGLHEYIASFIREDDIEVRAVTLDDECQGLPDDVLDDTDVLVWWGHVKHGEVKDELVEKIQKRILGGMGFIALHSAHNSKVFKKMMGTTCSLKWRDHSRERIWCVCPSHPISEGVDETFVLEDEEMYGEFFDIPKPDDVIFLGWYNSGEVFRSGCTFTRGNGKIFYFQPGHETNPAFKNENVQKIIKNAVRWACPSEKGNARECIHSEPYENA
jgi:trehalose utilization protein